MDEKDDDGEFSVAAHAYKSGIQTTTTKDGWSHVCVQPPNVPGHETQFDTLSILEEVQHGQFLDVDDNGKTGKDFRHSVLESWLHSSAPQHSAKVFISIRRIKKNLVWLYHKELGVVVDGQQLYEKFVKYKLAIAKKSISKIIVVQGLYMNAN